jgi:hypothetical protein
MSDSGINMVVIDLGEGVRYRSHPELGVRGSWSVEELQEELEWIKKMGIEPIPKLNFSATHDVWLGEYSRCVSTPLYYKVCSDLIKEVTTIFNVPRFFHLGMDEESAQFVSSQKEYQYIVVRQNELWWHDLKFMVKCVEKRAVRAWVWSDYLWDHPEEYIKNMPHTVLQSNWYYVNPYKKISSTSTTWKKTWRDAFIKLSETGFKQIPAASICAYKENISDLARYCLQKINTPGLQGFMQTSWLPTTQEFYEKHILAIDATKDAIEAYDRM